MDWSTIYERLAQQPNDVDAWSEVHAIVHTWAHAALRRFGAHVVEDAVADTCSAVAIAFARARGPATFGGFVLGEFYNVRRRVIRTQRQATRPLPDLDVAVTDADDGVDVDDRVTLMTGLEALTRRQRQAVLLRYAEAWSGREIAAHLGVSEVNARRIVSDGIARLRRHFGCHSTGTSGGSNHRPLASTASVQPPSGAGVVSQDRCKSGSQANLVKVFRSS